VFETKGGRMKPSSIGALVIMVFVPSAMLSAKPTVRLLEPPPVTSDSEYTGVWFEGYVFEESRGQVFHATSNRIAHGRFA
jgi:hypothetical protein